MTPRLLKADEISCRVQQVTESKGAIILLYKDARVDMNILDETYGPMNWKREHQTIDGNLYCTISVWDDTKAQWVSKQDVGTESFTEATKGEASDAFKRAGFNWGIGRELYTGPFIFVQLQEGEWSINPRTNKPQATFRFGLSVKEITYTDKREVKTLVLVDKNGTERFIYGKGKYKPAEIEEPKPQAKPPVKPLARVTVTQTDAEMQRRGDEIKNLFEGFGYSGDDYKRVATELKSKNPREMTLPEFTEHMKSVREFLEGMKA